MTAQRLPVHFDADPKKVILLYLDPVEDSNRLIRFAEFAKKLSDEEAELFHTGTRELFEKRHRHFNEAVLQYADQGLQALSRSVSLTEKQKLVFGSYLTKEYSVEAAAL